jgi:hypothetical protein
MAIDLQKKLFQEGVEKILPEIAFVQNYGVTFDELRNQLDEIYDRVCKMDLESDEIHVKILKVGNRFDMWLESLGKLPVEKLMLIKNHFYRWVENIEHERLEKASEGEAFEETKIIKFPVKIR